MKHAEILQTATDLYKDRGLSYGHPTDNMARAAGLISAYLEMPITDYQVAVILALVKIARSIEDAQKIDTWIDGASYLAIAGQLATEENELYVYDNWKAFSDRFTNIWINIKNSANKGVADFMMAIDKLQKAMGYQLFDVSGMTKYQEEQKVVAAEFKTIGETVDSLKGKFKSLFMAAPGKGTGGGGTEGTGELVFGDGGAPTGGGTEGVPSATPVAAITAQSTGITNMLPTLDLLAIKLDTATASNLRLKETNEEVKNSFVAVETQMMSFGNTLTSALILAADAFSNLAVQGETDMKKMASAALQAARQVVSAYIKEGVAGIVKNILAGPTGKVLGPFAIAVAGAAGAGASVLFNTLSNKVSAPALAPGGLATALSGVAANVFSYVPEQIPAPAVVVVPDSPYMEFETIGLSMAYLNHN